MKKFAPLAFSTFLFYVLASVGMESPAESESPPSSVWDLPLSVEEAHRYVKILSQTLEGASNATEWTNIQRVLSNFTEVYGQPTTNIDLGTPAEAAQTRLNCARLIFGFGVGLPNNREKFNLQWVAHAVAAPHSLWPEDPHLTPEKYVALPQHIRVDQIKKVENELIYLIPRKIREEDYKYAKSLNKPATIGMFGLAGDDFDPTRDERVIREQLLALSNVFLSVDPVTRGKIVMRSRILESLLPRARPKKVISAQPLRRKQYQPNPLPEEDPTTDPETIVYVDDWGGGYNE